MNSKPKHLSFYKIAAKICKKPHKCIFFKKNFKKTNLLSLLNEMGISLKRIGALATMNVFLQQKNNDLL